MPRQERALAPVVDRFLAYKPTHTDLDLKILHRVQRAARSARHFVFDDAAATRLAQVIREVPELIVKHQQFARQPYDSMWVEIPFIRFIEELRQDEVDDAADHRVAYFFHHGDVYVVACGSKGNPHDPAFLVPVSYHLHTGFSLDEQVAMFKDFVPLAGMKGIDAFLWGSTYLNLSDEEREASRQQHNFSLLLDKESSPENLLHVFNSLISGSAGCLRNALAILLLMNRPNLTRYVRETPAKRTFVGGKLRHFMSHTVVTIDLDPTPAIRRIGTPEDEGTPRRRHEVRGHYCHNETYKQASAAGCEHEFINDQSATHPEDSWICTRCGGKRWWRAHHARGTAEVGFSMASYEVTGNAA